VAAIDIHAPDNATPRSIGFRWSYIVLPAAVLVIAVILGTVYYGRLPAETAYRFSGGEPVSTAGRGAVLAGALGVQLVLVLLSVCFTLFVTMLARRIQVAETPLNRMVFGIIGNLVALPQIIIAYAMLDIFLYNINETALPSLWIFALGAMVAGGIVLAVLFTRAVGLARRLKTANISGSDSDVRE
jgi:uncharacterized membrane protein